MSRDWNHNVKDHGPVNSGHSCKPKPLFSHRIVRCEDHVCVSCGHSKSEHLKAGCIHIFDSQSQQAPGKSICDCTGFLAGHQHQSLGLEDRTLMVPGPIH